MRCKVLVEGTSDVPVVEEILARRLKLVKGREFVVIAHRGKGRLPGPGEGVEEYTLLGALPATLRGLSQEPGLCVVVLVDSDTEDCRELKQRLLDMYAGLDAKPEIVLFRIAVEETESWLIADPEAVRQAFPQADVDRLRSIAPDAVVGAWERLAESLGRDPRIANTKRKKKTWAERIAPHLNLDAPVSPSLEAFISGVSRCLDQTQEQFPG
ncbi:MAG: DUF4276 family protein [Thermodesulfobacteriota bacterium]